MNYPISPPGLRILDNVQPHSFLDTNKNIIHPTLQHWQPQNQITGIIELLIQDFLDQPLQRIEIHQEFVVLNKEIEKPQIENSFGWTKEDAENACKTDLSKLSIEELRHLNDNEGDLISFYNNTDPMKQMDAQLVNAAADAKALAQANVYQRNSICAQMKILNESYEELKNLSKKVQDAKSGYMNARSEKIGSIYNNFSKQEKDCEYKMKDFMKEWSSESKDHKKQVKEYMAILQDYQQAMIYRRKLTEYTASSQIS